ncbi:MAG: FxLYD domain-containing protein [Candidatus Doudnabacteria bacterium]|nr:FxLYD domain-containing protein [Candidatus Doudnabacteria bacterium]
MEENQNQTQDRSEKIQEISMIVSDRIRSVEPKWWYALIGSFILIIPLYFILRAGFVSIIVSAHKFPAYVYEDETKVPLEVTDRKIFNLGNGDYDGYFKIKNSANFDWGVQAQAYTAVMSSTGGTELNRVEASTFVLPASEKIVFLPRFHADRDPTTLTVTLGSSQFLRRPNLAEVSLGVERLVLDNSGSHLVVSAAVKNKTPFTIKRIGLPVLLYDASNNVVGANYTNVDEVLYGEARSFQFSWPNKPAAVRAEILPEVNIFDPNIYKLPAGSSQFGE